MATLYNQATLFYNGNAINSNMATAELLEVLSGSKTSVTDTYFSGDEVTYVINVINSGASALTGLTVTDNLGAYTFEPAGTVTPLTYVDDSLLYFVNGTQQATPTSTINDGNLVISGISIPAGGNATLVYSATANQFAPIGAGSTIVNTATVSGGNLSTPLILTDTVTAESEARLTITKSISPSVVTENGQVTYTFVLQNTGNQEATTADAISIYDVFDPALSGITVTLNGTVWDASNYTYNEATGEFQTVAGNITVPAATYTQNPTTGAWMINPGITTVTVTGTI
jgi:uncharacterized repeat protein (TIGR01451 family)